jgi:hypothetical protein
LLPYIAPNYVVASRRLVVELVETLGFGGEAISFSTETPIKTGDCFVGKRKTPPRNDICTVENDKQKEN